MTKSAFEELASAGSLGDEFLTAFKEASRLQEERKQAGIVEKLGLYFDLSDDGSVSAVVNGRNNVVLIVK